MSRVTKANATMRLVGRRMYTIANRSVYEWKGKCLRFSAVRKVLCDTRARCLTACQHGQSAPF